MTDLYGVKIVPLGDKPDEVVFISGAKLTHQENLTTGEKKKIISFIDAIKVKNLATPKDKKGERE